MFPASAAAGSLTNFRFFQNNPSGPSPFQQHSASSNLNEQQQQLEDDCPVDPTNLDFIINSIAGLCADFSAPQENGNAFNQPQPQPQPHQLSTQPLIQVLPPPPATFSIDVPPPPPAANTVQWDIWVDKWDSDPTAGGKAAQTNLNRIESFTDRQLLAESLDACPPTMLPFCTSLHVMTADVSPTYEDPINRLGGHFKMSTNDLASAESIWGTVRMALLCDLFPGMNRIVGITIFRKQRTNYAIKVWLRNSMDKQHIHEVKSFLHGTIDRSKVLCMRFCPHKFILQTISNQRKDFEIKALSRSLTQGGLVQHFRLLQMAQDGQVAPPLISGSRSFSIPASISVDDAHLGQGLAAPFAALGGQSPAVSHGVTPSLTPDAKTPLRFANLTLAPSSNPFELSPTQEQQTAFPPRAFPANGKGSVDNLDYLRGASFNPNRQANQQTPARNVGPMQPFPLQSLESLKSLYFSDANSLQGMSTSESTELPSRFGSGFVGLNNSLVQNGNNTPLNTSMSGSFSSSSSFPAPWRSLKSFEIQSSDYPYASLTPFVFSSSASVGSAGLSDVMSSSTSMNSIGGGRPTTGFLVRNFNAAAAAHQATVPPSATDSALFAQRTGNSANRPPVKPHISSSQTVSSLRGPGNPPQMPFSPTEECITSPQIGPTISPQFLLHLLQSQHAEAHLVKDPM